MQPCWHPDFNSVRSIDVGLLNIAKSSSLVVKLLWTLASNAWKYLFQLWKCWHREAYLLQVPESGGFILWVLSLPESWSFKPSHHKSAVFVCPTRLKWKLMPATRRLQRRAKPFHDGLDIKPPVWRTLKTDCGGSEVGTALVSQRRPRKPQSENPDTPLIKGSGWEQLHKNQD